MSKNIGRSFFMRVTALIISKTLADCSLVIHSPEKLRFSVDFFFGLDLRKLHVCSNLFERCSLSGWDWVVGLWLAALTIKANSATVQMRLLWLFCVVHSVLHKIIWPEPDLRLSPLFTVSFSSVYYDRDGWMLLVRRKASSHSLAITKDRGQIKSPRETYLFRIWTIGGMDKTSSPPQVKLSLLRRNSFKNSRSGFNITCSILFGNSGIWRMAINHAVLNKVQKGISTGLKKEQKKVMLQKI